MSFAIIETGGKQYKVSASKILEIEKLDAEKGKTIKFKNVLLLNDDKSTEIGNPSIEGATVEAKLLEKNFFCSIFSPLIISSILLMSLPA